jgi:hypothetical protein
MSINTPTKNTTIGNFKTPIGLDYDIFQTFDEKGALSLAMDYQGIISGYNAGVGNIVFSGVPTGTCQPAQTAVNSSNGAFYDCIGGTWTLISGSGGLVSPVVTPNPLAFDISLNFKGPNPWVDVTRYGVRAPGPVTSTPVSLGLTANINSGSAAATISSASSFINGDGVVIYGAGTTHSMTTPAGVTVTPSVAAAGTGTGIVVNAPAGSTTYNYQVIARNKTGGLTAASTVATTTTGAASLGRQSVNISTLSRSTNITTVVTSTAHTLSIGSMVYISTTSDDTDFGGWFVVATVPDNTHFTLLSGLDTRNGAVASATGGTAVWFNCNHITWTQVTGAFQYHIYGRTGGTLTWLGCSRLSSVTGGLVDLTFDDFGSPMMDNFKQPGLIPSSPPVSATSNSLSTTIVSGAGTTSLVLANTASTSVSGATIRFDNTPNILAAANATTNPDNKSSLLYFPFSTTGQPYPINSYLALPAHLSVSLTTGLYVNDTIEVAQGSSWSGDVIPQGLNPPSFGQNGWPIIGINEANPGMYIPFNVISYWKGLTFLGQGLLNGGLLVFGDQVTPITFEDVNFIESTSSTSYMGIGLILRGDTVGSNNSSFVNMFRNVLFSGGPTQSNGACATPYMYCNGCGLTSFNRLNLSVRGIFFRPVGAGGDLEIDTGRQQGGLMPTIMYCNTSGNSSITSNAIRHFEQDTTAHPIFANMSGEASLLYLEGAGYPGLVSGADSGLVTGQPMPNISGMNVIPNGFTGQNVRIDASIYGTAIDGVFNSTGVGTANYAYSSHQFNCGLNIGKGYSIFATGPTPAAPTASVSSGGGVSVGTHTYQVVPVWANGAEGVLSPSSNSVTTTTGNQTVTVTWSAITPAPIGYDVYQDGQLVSMGVGNCTTIPQYTGTSAVITNIVCGPSTSVPAGGPTILNVNGLFSPALTLSPVLFANLGTPNNGTFYYCPDCAVANPCAGSGTGAFAKRLNGTWICN